MAQFVTQSLKQRFSDWLDKRIAKGIEHYGVPLTTFNGRSAELDMLEELLDFMQYQEQSRLELLAKIGGVNMQTFWIVYAPSGARGIRNFSTLEEAKKCALQLVHDGAKHVAVFMAIGEYVISEPTWRDAVAPNP